MPDKAALKIQLHAQIKQGVPLEKIQVPHKSSLWIGALNKHPQALENSNVAIKSVARWCSQSPSLLMHLPTQWSKDLVQQVLEQCLPAKDKTLLEKLVVKYYDALSSSSLFLDSPLFPDALPAEFVLKKLENFYSETSRQPFTQHGSHAFQEWLMRHSQEHSDIERYVKTIAEAVRQRNKASLCSMEETEGSVLAVTQQAFPPYIRRKVISNTLWAKYCPRMIHTASITWTDKDFHDWARYVTPDQLAYIAPKILENETPFRGVSTHVLNPILEQLRIMHSIDGYTPLFVDCSQDNPSGQLETNVSFS